MSTHCWGHDTDVLEDVTHNWLDGFGTGLVTGSDDAEALNLDSGEYWVLPAVETGTITIVITYDQYDSGSGDEGDIEYKTGASEALCEAEEWAAYTTPFTSDGWVQIRLSKEFLDLDTVVIETEDTEVIDTEDTDSI